MSFKQISIWAINLDYIRVFKELKVYYCLFD